MKKTILFTALALITFTGFAQVKKDPSKSEPPKVTAPAPKQFVIILSEAELAGLYNFIQSADDYSPSGRQKYLQELDKHVKEIPQLTDTTKLKK
jgi:hypothetical protein